MLLASATEERSKALVELLCRLGEWLYRHAAVVPFDSKIDSWSSYAIAIEI